MQTNNIAHASEFTDEYVNANSYKISLQLGHLLLLVAYWPDPLWRKMAWRGVHVGLAPAGTQVAWFLDDPIFKTFDGRESNEALFQFHVSLGLNYDPDF
jgi:hypothetical protein